LARGKQPAAPQPVKMTVEEMRRGVQRLQKRLAAVEAFDPATLSSSDPYGTLRPLETDIESALLETFGNDTVEYRRFQSAASLAGWPISFTGEVSHSRKIHYVSTSRTQAIQLLTAAINLLEERIADAPADAVPSPPPIPASFSRRIFVVHGHDNEPKEATARFLEGLGFEPVILHERPNKGRTIIQKFQEEAADVGFAVVLMSADDEMRDGLKRARQNVVLELGFFLGKLGPSRVAAIVKGSVERPSDFDGVVYIPFDGAWQRELASELDAAGYEVDFNKIMKKRRDNA
jgi:predicted nucleotide-binding protein